MAKIEKNCKIGSGCIFGEHVTIKKGCVIGDNVTILNNTKIHPHVVIKPDLIIESNCLIENHAVITTNINHDRTIIGAYRKTVSEKIDNYYLLAAYDNFYNRQSYWNVYTIKDSEWIASYTGYHIKTMVIDFSVQEILERLFNNKEIIFYDKDWKKLQYRGRRI